MDINPRSSRSNKSDRRSIRVEPNALDHTVIEKQGIKYDSAMVRKLATADNAGILPVAPGAPSSQRRKREVL